MKAIGRVVDGQIELEETLPVPDGTNVLISVEPYEEGEYDLSEEEDAALHAAELSLDRGESVDLESVLAKLRARRALS